MSEDDESVVLIDFSSMDVTVERSNHSLRLNTSTASEITFDSSDDLDESLGSEEEDVNTYSDYLQMLKASNRQKKNGPQNNSSKNPPTRERPMNRLFSSQPLNKFRTRPRCGQIATVFDEPLNLSCKPPVAPKRLPFLDDSFVTALTASTTTLGSDGLQWLVIGKEWKGEENERKDKAMEIPKRSKSREGKPRFFRRGSQKPGKITQLSSTSSDLTSKKSSALLEI